MAQEITLTLTGYRADEALPARDGTYMAFTTTGTFLHMHYCKKYGMWNVYEDLTEEQAQRYKIDITHWFRLPEATALKGDAPHD